MNKAKHCIKKDADITRTFCFLFYFLHLLLFFHAANLRISTDLKDLSPTITQSVEQQEIIDKFSNNIQHRFILLVRSDNTKNVEQASAELAEQLHAIDNLTVSSENQASIKNIVKALKPYRHHLLTPQQLYELENKSTDTLSKQAEEALYQFDSAVRLLPFNEDPLGYLSNYIFFLLSKLNSHKSETPDSVKSNSIAVRISDSNLDMKAQTLLFNTINSIEKKIETDYSVEIFHSGLFFFAAEAAISSKADIEFISTGSTILIILMLLFVFRSLWPLLLPVISIALGVIFAIAVNDYLYGNIHILTIVFGASLIGIVIDYSLHFFYHHIQSHTNNNKHLYRALLLSLITSLIGYSALSLSDLAALQKIALFSCCGLLMAWLSVIVLGKLMLKPNTSTEQYLLPKLVNIIYFLIPKSKKSLTLCLAILFIATLSSSYFIGFNTNDDPRLFYSLSERLLKEEKQVNATIKKYEPGRFFIIHGESEESIRRELKKLRHDIKQLDPKSFLYSITDFVPNEVTQRSHYRKQEKLYLADGVIAKLYKNLQVNNNEFESLQKHYLASSNNIINPDILIRSSEDILPTWFKQDQRFSTIVLISHGSNTSQFGTVASKLHHVEYINSVALASTVLKEQRISATNTLLLAFILVAILLILYYKQTSSLFALLVPISAVSVILLYLLVSQETLTLFHIMALFLVLGLGMDYVIFSKEMIEYKNITLQAILLSALTTSISFGFLSMSSIPIAQSFGFTILIGNTVNLLGTVTYSYFIHKHNYS